MLKVLVVHEIDYFGSPVFEFQEFSEAIQELGHQVLVLDLRERLKKGTRRHSDGKRGFRKARTTGELINVETPWLSIPGNAFRPIAVLIHLFSLLRIFLRSKPDIVFSYSVPTSGPTVAILGRLFRVPVVHRAIDVSHKLRPGLFDPIVRITERLTFRLSTYVSTHNRALARYIQEQGCRAQKIFLHYPPVNLEHFRSAKKRPKAPPIKIIFVGTLSDFSGLYEFMESAKASKSEHPWQLKIVGDGQARSRLEAYCSRLGLEEQITFVGWTNYENVQKELEWANVAITPFRKTLLTDFALPQKTIQYLSAGLPVVSTALRGSVEELAEYGGIYFVQSPQDVFSTSMKVAFHEPPRQASDLAKFDRWSSTKALVAFLEQVLG